MITARLRDEWTEALRSGTYPRGTTRLLSDDGCYCAIGVLGKLAGIPDEDLVLDEAYTEITRATGLSESLMCAVFIRNDGLSAGGTGMAWPDLADWIDAHVPADYGEPLAV